jgi:hypothetical protein
MSTLTALPTVRGDLLLLTGDPIDSDEHAFAAGAALLVDAALAGAIDVAGRRILGFDRRTVVLGPGEPADPLLAALRQQVAAGAPDGPWGWCRHTATYAAEATHEELIDVGLAAPRLPSLLGLRTLEAWDDHDASARVEAALNGTGAGADVALAVLLGGRERALWRSAKTLPPAALAVLEALEAWRIREANTAH